MNPRSEWSGSHPVGRSLPICSNMYTYERFFGTAFIYGRAPVRSETHFERRAGFFLTGIKNVRPENPTPDFEFLKSLQGMFVAMSQATLCNFLFDKTIGNLPRAPTAARDRDFEAPEPQTRLGYRLAKGQTSSAKSSRHRYGRFPVELSHKNRCGTT